jgi:hypothetical protein
MAIHPADELLEAPGMDSREAWILMTEKKLQLSERSGDKTLQGHTPGSVSTSGQFQVYAKMSINSMKDEQRKVAVILNKIEDQIAACETGLIKTLRADEEQ